VSTANFGSRYWNITQSSTGVPYKVTLSSTGVILTSGATVRMIRREGATTTSNAVTTPNYTNSTSFTATDVSNDVALGETGIPLTISGVTANNKIYDGNATATVAGTPILSAAISGDTVTLSGTPAYVFNNKNAGTGKAVTVSGFTLSGASAGAYSLPSPNQIAGLTANISQLALSASIVAPITKAYNGSTVATLNASNNYNYSNIVGSDVVSISTTTGAYDTKNVGTGKTVTVSSPTLTGADAGNYSISSVTGNVGEITAKALTVTGATTANKVYDGNTTAIVTGGSLVGVVSPDVVTLTQSGTYSNSVVGGPYTITSTSTLGGADAGNYTLTQPTLTSRSITKLALTIAGATAADKVYDNSTVAIVTGGSLVGIVSPDVVTLTQSGTFSSKNVGTWVVTSTSTLGGADAANYSLTQPTLNSASISKFALTISGATTADKVYNGTTTALVTGGSLVGVFSGDTVTLTQSGDYSSANAGGTYTVTSNCSISGSSSGNYSLTQPSLADASITKKGLTVSGATTANKTYDGNDIAAVTGVILSGVVGSEDVTLTLAATYSSSQVGGPYVITPNASLGGTANLNNYALTQPTLVSRSITAKALTVSGATTADKIYDSNNTAIITGATLVGVVSGEDVTLNATGTYSSSNVGGPYTITSTSTLAGVDKDNYTLTQPSLTPRSITLKGLTVTGATTANKVYNGTTTAIVTGGSLVGVVPGDSVSLTQSGDYSSADAGGPYVITPNFSISGADAANYSLAQPSLSNASITKKTLTVINAVTANKTYDGNNIASVTGASLSGVVGSEDVTLTLAATYSSSQVGGPYVITPNASLGGSANLNNYTLTQPTLVSRSITGLPLTISGATTSDKVYDSTNAATITGATLVGVLSGESVTLNVSGTYSSSNAGGPYAITSTSSLSGPDAGNYTLTQPSLTSRSISQKALTVTGATTADKAYDGTTTAVVTGGSLVGVVSGDAVNLVQTGDYSSANAGGPYVITSNCSIAGADSPNYTLTQPSLANRSITKKELTIAGVTTSNKQYDGNNIATLGGTLSGVVGTEDVTLVKSATYASKDAGGPYVITPNCSIIGADIANYTFTQPTLVSRSITKIALTVSGVTASDKVYDGLTTATINTASAVLNTGVLSGETVTLNTSSTANFNDKNVGTAKTVTASGFSISGAAAGNYTLTQPTATADITVKALTITASDQNLCSGSTFSPAGTEFTRDFVVTGDITSVTLTKTGAGVLDGLGRITYSIVPSAAQGPGVGNYSISYTNGTLTTNPTPTAAITVNNATACVNDTTPLVTFTGANGTAGYRFGYKINGGTTLFANSATNIATVAVTTGTPRTDVYTLVSVQDLSTGCSQTQSGTVSVTIGACTALAPQFRGTTLTDLNNTLSAISVTGAATYRYQITNLTTNAVSVLERSDVNRVLFSLVQFQASPASPTQIITYNTTYSIRVAVDNGSFIYGPAYTVKTPVQVPTCKLANKYCGATISAINEPVYANTVYNAVKYKFKVSGPGITGEEIVLNGAGLNLTQLTQNVILYGTPYTVEVKASVDGTTYPTAYGTICTVTTPFTPPTSRIDPKYCGKTVSMSSGIFPLAVYGADAYYFEVSGGGLAAPVGFETTTVAAPNFKFNQIAGATTNKTYSVRVSVRFNGVYPTTNGIDRLFGSSCTVSTGAARMTETDLGAMNVFNVSAFPNPFARHFSVQIESSSDEQVEIKVYDMIGRELEAHKATVSELSTREIGSNYPSGVYNVVVSQGDTVKSLRMIKR